VGSEANIVYLEEEITNLLERIVAMRNFQLGNPSLSSGVATSDVKSIVCGLQRTFFLMNLFNKSF
jgi:hypothetical protein